MDEFLHDLISHSNFSSRTSLKLQLLPKIILTHEPKKTHITSGLRVVNTEETPQRDNSKGDISYFQCRRSVPLSSISWLIIVSFMFKISHEDCNPESLIKS
ncbi:CLUMA_CG009142, isoform A [Clunio marinus]|uniref:CLUMA_CG009142, isoform A n=1 Tax=Clunio marinus TaxID=568069 RepID=A0A1J1I7X9_9DIPT|nr:CLUMA_CG009142, isoform A [Clunio marinus]